MNATKTINERFFMKGMFAIAIVMFFALSLTSIAMAQGKTYPLNYSLKGEVVSVDLLSRTLTVTPIEKAPFTIDMQGQFMFIMNEMTNVRMCDQDKTVQEIKVGDVVTVEYSMEGSKLHADAINIPTPLVACLLE